MSVAHRQSAPTVLELDLFDPDALAEGVTGGRLEHHQVGPGRFSGRIVRRELDGMPLDTGRYSRPLISVGSFEPRSITVGCVLAAPESGIINASRFGPGDFVVFTEGAEMEYLVPGGTQWLAVQCDPDLLAGLGACDEGLRRTGVLSGGRANQAACLGLLRQAARLDGAHAGPPGIPGLDRRSLPELLAGLLGPQGHQRRRGSFRARAELVRRFRALAEADPRAPKSVLGLCRELGVSPRTLQLVFREHLGVTPIAYCASLRLTEAHRALLRGGEDNTQVTEVARRFGFAHMGRFAAAYRRQFGLLPSETLQHRKGLWMAV
jgi:AraC family ethanolamine operon transcriptional activator